jgi:hypothetical protein
VLIPILFIPPLTKKTPITKNMRDRKGRRYTFMGTHDKQEEKSRTS